MSTQSEAEEPNPNLPPWDPSVVRQQSILHVQEMEDRHNYNRRVWFERAVENWLLNWRNNPNLVQPVPQPPLKLHYTWVAPDDDDDIGSNPIDKVEGPDFVAEPFIPPKRPDKPEPFPDGVVAFGPPAEDGMGSYLVAVNNTVPPGTHANKDGIEYVLIQMGRIGTLRYRKLWVPVEGG